MTTLKESAADWNDLELDPMDIDSIVMEYTYRLSGDEESPLCTPKFIRNSHRQHVKYILNQLHQWAGQRIIPNLLVEKDDYNAGYNRAIRDIQNELVNRL